MSLHTLKSKHYYLPEHEKQSVFCYWRRKKGPKPEYVIQNHPGILWNGISQDAENRVINIIYDAVDQDEIHAFMTELGCRVFV